MSFVLINTRTMVSLSLIKTDSDAIKVKGSEARFSAHAVWDLRRFSALRAMHAIFNFLRYQFDED